MLLEQGEDIDIYAHLTKSMQDRAAETMIFWQGINKLRVINDKESSGSLLFAGK